MIWYRQPYDRYGLRPKGIEKMLTNTPTVPDERVWQELVDALTPSPIRHRSRDGSSRNYSVVLQFQRRFRYR